VAEDLVTPGIAQIVKMNRSGTFGSGIAAKQPQAPGQAKSTHLLPLEGLRALDLSGEMGMLCGKLLADLGADVIKIEKPGGDPARNIGPFFQDSEDPQQSLFWFAVNAGKRGITLNIEAREGRALFMRLARAADFIIESFAPGHMDRLGLGYPDLSAANAQVILVSITPFGQSGPRKDYVGSDIVAMAMAGFMYGVGDADRPPLRMSVDQAYAHAGLQAATASLFALRHRAHSGKGQMVDVSIQESLIPCASISPLRWTYEGAIGKRVGARNHTAHYSRKSIFRCSDGYVAWQLKMGKLGPRTRRMVELMERSGLAGDLSGINWETTDYGHTPPEQLERWEDQFAEFFLTKTRAWLYDNSIELDLALMPLNTIQDLLADPQLAERNFWLKVDHPELGTHVICPGPPFKTTRELLRPGTRAPLLAEHNKDVYEEELCIPGEELIRLHQAGVV